MNLKTVILIFIFVFSQSCKKDHTHKYAFESNKLLIDIPPSFNKVNPSEAKENLKEGISFNKKEGFESSFNQNSIFSYKKGNFTSLTAKYYPLKFDSIKDYNAAFNKLKVNLFNYIKKESIEDTDVKLDSFSRTEFINGYLFFVFEHSITSKDINGKKTDYRMLRYSTPIQDYDLVIDANYIIIDSSYKYLNDKVKILDAINSIRILE